MADGSTPEAAKVRKKPGPKPGPVQVATGDYSNTLYRPEYCEKVIEWGKLGKSITWMATRLDVEKSTVQMWAKVHVQFNAALTRAVQNSQAYWEDEGQDGMKSREFNAAVWARNMASRFREDWTETKNVNQTNEDGPNKAAATENDRARSLELLKRLGLVGAADRAGKPAQGEGEDEFSVLRNGH